MEGCRKSCAKGAALKGHMPVVNRLLKMPAVDVVKTLV